jgi:F-type H+-transporting ATPase subunit delta
VAVLDKMNAKLGMLKELRNLLAVLIDHGRIGQVVEVAEAWRAVLQQRMGIHPVEIISARSLDASQRAALEAEAARLAGGRIEASYREDASMIGGAVVRIGSTVYDGSLRGRLERLKEALTAG